MGLLGIPGSLRAGSYNRALLEAAGVALFERLADVPPYAEDLDGDAPPPAVGVLRAQIAGSCGVLIATPEYNASVPGQLKNALDWVSRPYPGNVLRDKPVAVVGASTGMFGGVWAQDDLRRILRTIGARVVEDGVAVAYADKAFAADGSLADGVAADGLAATVRRLGQAAACG